MRLIHNPTFVYCFLSFNRLAHSARTNCWVERMLTKEGIESKNLIDESHHWIEAMGWINESKPQTTPKLQIRAALGSSLDGLGGLWFFSRESSDALGDSWAMLERSWRPMRWSKQESIDTITDLVNNSVPLISSISEEAGHQAASSMQIPMPF